MAYIGRGTDKISNIEKLDTITFDGSSSYTLQKNSVNFTPNSANSLQVSIDGVVQAGNFTVSGSTIDFGVAIPATSTNDFIFHYGTGLVTTVADGAITTAKLGDASVTSAKLDAGKVLQVIQSIITTTQNTTSTSYVTSNLSASITPSSTSNKVLIMLSGGNAFNNTNNQNVLIAFYRGATELASSPHGIVQNTSGTNSFKSSWSASYLDSPSSTSSLTYTPYYKVSGGTGYFNEATVSVQLTLMEIAG